MKVTIDILDFAKVIINIVVKYQNLPDLIIIFQSLFFISNFGFYYNIC